jgi:ABC-2 type transport system ATP-binding protein
LTTHDLADVAALCRRIILIDHGLVLYDGTIDELIKAYAPPRQVIVTLVDGTGDRLVVGRHAGERDEDGRYHFTLSADDPVPALMTALTGEHDVRDLAVAEPDLESVIKQIYANREPP